VSLRARLLVTTIALVAVGLLAVDVVTYRSTATFLTNRLDEQLVRSREVLASAIQRGLPIGAGVGGDGRSVGDDLLPPGAYAAVLAPDGSVAWSRPFPGYGGDTIAPPLLPGAFPIAASLDSPPVFFSAPARDGSTSYRVLATGGGPQGTFVVAIPLDDVRATLGRILRVELVVTVVVLAALTALALWLVRLGLRPLEGMGETAGAIAAGDLSRRVEPATERTEVGRLGLALNAMLAQIEQAFEQRRLSEERLRRFVGDASHELRTPLTSIRGYAELFRRGAESRPEDLAKTMRRIEDEAARMGILVDDLLLLARLDQGRPLERDPVDLTALATEAVEAARIVDPAREITLDAATTALVLGDAGRLRQLIDNLLDNARQHTPPDTRVDVRVVEQPSEVTLIVADRGPGLTQEEGSRIFERFYRGDPARARQTGGVGLGLSIVASIVEAHGGQVTAGPGEEGGACFSVRLPSLSTVPPPPVPTGEASGGP
jgi:two-component system OmpR family sensor kinase